MTDEPTGGLLAVYGHPDDEGQATGTMAAFLARGEPVTLVCATRGEVGEISDPSLATPETLGYVRELELRAAMAQIGLADVRFLPYRDSGMAGTPENDDPRSLHQAAVQDVTEQLVAIIRARRPRIVLTWSPDGGYGHPDHIAANKATVAAYDASADPAAYPEAGAPFQPDGLFWSTFRMKHFAALFEELEARGLAPEPPDEEMRKRFAEARRQPDAVVSVEHDVRVFSAIKQRASQMHRSQFGEGSLFGKLPPDMWDRVFGVERFYRARPPWPDGAQLLTGFE